MYDCYNGATFPQRGKQQVGIGKQYFDKLARIIVKAMEPLRADTGVITSLARGVLLRYSNF